MGLNKAQCIGNLGADPEMRFMPNGSPVTSFRVAASRRYYNNQQDLIEETEWFYVVVYGKQAESCNKYLDKGKMVYCEGRLKTRNWTDQENKKHYRTELIANTVQFLTKGSNALGTPDDETVDPAAEPEPEPEVSPATPEVVAAAKALIAAENKKLREEKASEEKASKGTPVKK